jgi:hypothetical protein
MSDRWVSDEKWIALVFAAGVLAGFTLKAHSMEHLPPYPLPYDPVCSEPVQIGNAAFNQVTCLFEGAPYAPPDGLRHPVGFVLPRPLVGKYPVVISRHGYTAVPVTCTNNNGSRAGTIVIKPCSAFWPDQRNWGTRPLLMNWGGPFLGVNVEGFQAGEALDTALWTWGSHIDWGKGVTLEGTSEGGTYSILQSILAPDFLQRNISIVDATLPHTNFVSPNGQYWIDPAVRAAWGNFDYRLADVETAMASGKLDNIYFRIRGASNDSLGRVDLAFFSACDRWRIACYGTWDQGGHSATGEPGVNLPRGLYSGPGSQVRLDQPLIVFTHSTANYWGVRGHFNAGLEWKAAIDTKDRVVVPIRYVAHQNMGGDIPDQPRAATFDLTVRRFKAFQPRVGERLRYVIGPVSGDVLITVAGEITITGLTLESSETYTELRIEK